MTYATSITWNRCWRVSFQAGLDTKALAVTVAARPEPTPSWILIYFMSRYHCWTFGSPCRSCHDVMRFHRYKVTSEIDTSFPRKLLEEGSASSLPVFMDIRTARHSTIVTPSPLSTPSPAEAAVAYPSPARKKRRHAVSDHPTHSAHKIAIDPASPGAVAEMAAREMACSVTPTALSWALLSLLADGGVGTKRSGVVCGEHNTGSGRRQGHLLPRSRDRYPMPVREGRG